MLILHQCFSNHLWFWCVFVIVDWFLDFVAEIRAIFMWSRKGNLSLRASGLKRLENCVWLILGNMPHWLVKSMFPIFFLDWSNMQILKNARHFLISSYYTMWAVKLIVMGADFVLSSSVFLVLLSVVSTFSSSV